MITAFKFIGNNTPVAALFPSKKAALSNANDWFLPVDAAELANQTVLAPTSEMVKLYNSLAETPVKKFTDRATAATRLWAIVQQKVTPMTDTNVADDVSAKMAAATAAETEARNKKAAEQAEKKAAAEKAAEERKAAKAAKAEEKAKAAAEKAAKKAEEKAARDAAKAEKAANKGTNVRTSKFKGMILRHSIAKDAENNVKNPRRVGSHGERSLQIIIDAGDAGISTEDYLKAGGRMNDLHWDVDHGSVKAEAPTA